jgi:hypothetical protein
MEHHRSVALLHQKPAIEEEFYCYLQIPYKMKIYAALVLPNVFVKGQLCA